MPGPGNPGEDDLLRARQARMNTSPFTAEVRAAYAAFAQVTDRATALNLHRHGVTWDDVNDYSASGAIPPSDFLTMTRLRTAGVTPRRWHAWTKFAEEHSTPVSAADAITYAAHDVNPRQVSPFYRDRTGVYWSPGDIAGFIRSGVTSETVSEYVRNGVTTAHVIKRLGVLGCTPATVAAYRGSAGVERSGPEFSRGLLRYYEELCRSVTRPEVARAAAAAGIAPDEAHAWDDTGLPADRIGLYLCAGISADEWYGDPTVQEADTEALTMLAALHGRQPAA